MINFLDLNRTINFYDKKIMKLILDNNDFKNQKFFNSSIVSLKNKTNLFDILNEQINLDGSLIIGEVYSQFFSPAVKEIE